MIPIIKLCFIVAVFGTIGAQVTQLPVGESFVQNGLQCTCQDYDECAADVNICGSNSVCTNSIGSYSCACEPGYVSPTNDGVECQDSDECVTDPNACGSNTVCANSIGSYSCACEPGYYPGESNDCQIGRYKISVHTARTMWAGTDGMIHITLVGANGQHEIIKDASECQRSGIFRQCTFERDDTDTFYENSDVGELIEIKVRLNPGGRWIGSGDDWTFDQFSVCLENTGTKYEKTGQIELEFNQEKIWGASDLTRGSC